MDTLFPISDAIVMARFLSVSATSALPAPDVFATNVTI